MKNKTIEEIIVSFFDFLLHKREDTKHDSNI